MSSPHWPRLRLGRLGYRGAALLMFGLIYVFIGLAVLTNTEVNPVLFHTQLPIWFRILIWSGAGGVATVAALAKRRWPTMAHVGFGVLVIGPGERMLSYGRALIGEPAFNWLAATLIYLLLTGVVVLLPGWPEPPEIPADT